MAAMPSLRNPGNIAAAPSATVRVPLGERAYDVLIGGGLLRSAGVHIKRAVRSAKCAVVTDENVAAHHLQALEDALRSENMLAGSIVLPAGEATKRFEQLSLLSEKLLGLGIERGDLVVPFGGGVIGDLAGFAASILRRGVRFVQVPTSLLAMVDSSVGGKTGINTPQGKNLIGTFHQPSLVLADLDVLKTLPERELRAGYAEVAKYGLLGDADFFAWLEGNWQGVFKLQQTELLKVVETSVAAKAGVVARDEKESGERALLNLGHTFGHALEAYCGYSQTLLHGEAIAIGMCLAFELSEQLDLCPAGSSERVRRHFEAVGLPTRIRDIKTNTPPSLEDLIRLMGQDKKVRAGRLAFVLARGIGDAFVTNDVAQGDLAGFLKDRLSVA